MKKGDLVTWIPEMSRYGGLLIVVRKHPQANLFQCWDSRYGETGWIEPKHLVVVAECKNTESGESTDEI